jgi:hypothetical protein
MWILLASLCLLQPVSWAQEDSLNGDWDEPDALPVFQQAPDGSTLPVNPWRNTPASPPVATPAPAKAAPKPGKPKKSWWPLKKRESLPPPPDPEKIINVGARETPASPDPLFRLPMAIELGQTGYLPPGFYLARQRPAAGGGIELLLYQQNKLMAVVPVQSAGEAHPNTPVTPIATKKPLPPTRVVQATVATDQQTLIITLREGDTLYQSDPLPTVVDRRPQLRY